MKPLDVATLKRANKREYLYEIIFEVIHNHLAPLYSGISGIIDLNNNNNNKQ